MAVAHKAGIHVEGEVLLAVGRVQRPVDPFPVALIRQARVPETRVPPSSTLWVHRETVAAHIVSSLLAFRSHKAAESYHRPTPPRMETYRL